MEAGLAGASAADVLMRFESLGDSCEFGFVQRHYGAEPISLLRWAGAPLGGLVRALRAGFADLFRHEDLVMITDDLVMDTKYDLRFHCGAYHPKGVAGHLPLPRNEAAMAMHAREARHVGFQLRSTMESLAERSRVFVYKISGGMRMLDILELKAALDLYGPQRLLCVLKAREGLAAGEVKLLATGVKIGGIGRFAPYTNQQDTDPEGWLAVCRAALVGKWGDEAAGRLEVAEGAGRALADLGEAKSGAGFAPTALGVEIDNPALGRGLLNALYRGLLMRAPDEPGLQAHLAAMVSGEKAIEDVIETMLHSGEFAGQVEAFLGRYVGAGRASGG